jgi:hypothetical protein
MILVREPAIGPRERNSRAHRRRTGSAAPVARKAFLDRDGDDATGLRFARLSLARAPWQGEQRRPPASAPAMR